MDAKALQAGLDLLGADAAIWRSMRAAAALGSRRRWLTPHAQLTGRCRGQALFAVLRGFDDCRRAPDLDRKAPRQPDWEACATACGAPRPPPEHHGGLIPLTFR